MPIPIVPGPVCAATLIDNGVNIYEYTPGFVHAKTFVVDDEYAVVGTINLDYRSLYLHYECAAWLYKTSSVLEVRDDYLETLNISHKMTHDDLNSIPYYKKMFFAVHHTNCDIL